MWDPAYARILQAMTTTTAQFCITVFTGALAEICKHYNIQRRDRSTAKRIEPFHVRDVNSNARYFTIQYEIELEEKDLLNNPGMMATHCAGQFAGMFKDELKSQGAKKLHDVLILFDKLKPPIQMFNREEGVVVVGLRLWIAVPRLLQDGLKYKMGPTQEEKDLAEQKELTKKIDAITRKIAQGAYKH